MKGMKSCSKCNGGECKGGKNCMHEEKEENGSNGKNGKKGITVAIMVAMPKRGSRTAKNKAKKK
tara:strand:- start:1243 stop:1434 length:192 start_codon:yes stop_codon:yes gene_type:complete